MMEVLKMNGKVMHVILSTKYLGELRV